MKIAKNKLDLKFLKDEPVLKGDANYFKFYHTSVSPALQKIIESRDSGINTVGLFGPWGSGKSTVIENLKKEYKSSHVFIFDAWKYQGDPLRRTFLIKFLEFSNQEEIWKDGQKPDESF